MERWEGVSPPKGVLTFLCFFACVLSSFLELLERDVRPVQVEEVEGS